MEPRHPLLGEVDDPGERPDLTAVRVPRDLQPHVERRSLRELAGLVGEGASCTRRIPSITLTVVLCVMMVEPSAD